MLFNVVYICEDVCACMHVICVCVSYLSNTPESSADVHNLHFSFVQ